MSKDNRLKQPLTLPHQISLRAREKSERNGEVTETILERIYDGMTPNQRGAVDKFLMALCGSSLPDMQACNGQVEKAHNVHAEEMLDGLNTRQRIDLFKTFDCIDLFANEMKERFAQKTREGRSGYDGPVIVRPVAEEIADRLERLRDGEEGVSVGLGNWAYIAWYRENILIK
jgi:hypothetical protein